jgi:regulator of extracellular matrix RemA (YlzA/DUF370 family)
MTPSTTNNRELKRMDLEAKRRDELLDSELDRVTGGLVVVTPQNVTLLGPALLIPSLEKILHK